MRYKRFSLQVQGESILRRLRLLVFVRLNAVLQSSHDL